MFQIELVSEIRLVCYSQYKIKFVKVLFISHASHLQRKTQIQQKIEILSQQMSRRKKPARTGN